MVVDGPPCTDTAPLEMVHGESHEHDHNARALLILHEVDAEQLGPGASPGPRLVIGRWGDNDLFERHFIIRSTLQTARRTARDRVSRTFNYDGDHDLQSCK